MIKRKAAVLLAIVCLLIPATGCWDRRELQERSFVLAVGIDVAGLEEEDAGLLRHSPQAYGKERYKIGLQVLKFNTGGDDKGKSKTYVMYGTGESIFEIIRGMLGQSSKSLWFEHLQAVVISEGVLKQSDLSEVLDFFKRYGEMRSRIKVYATSGKAAKVLEFQPPSNEAGGMYLANAVRLYYISLSIPGTRNDLGYITQYMDLKTGVLLPRLEVEDKIIRVAGGAVFAQNQFVGYMDKEAMAGLRIMKGTMQSGVFTVLCPRHLTHRVAFELHSQSSKLRPYQAKGRLRFTLDSRMYGTVTEVQAARGEDDPLDPGYLSELSDAVAAEIKSRIRYTQQVLQNDLKTETVGVFSLPLRRYEPAIWEEVQPVWAEIYPDIPLDINVQVVINGSGSHR